jgi:hypothetical protein
MLKRKNIWLMHCGETIQPAWNSFFKVLEIQTYQVGMGQNMSKQYTPLKVSRSCGSHEFFSCDLSQKPKRPRWDDPPKRGTACGNVDCWCVEPAWLSV